MNHDDLHEALREIANGAVIYGPALLRPVPGSGVPASDGYREVRPLVSLLPPGKGVIARYQKDDDMQIESIIRYPSARQRGLGAMDSVRDRVEAAGRHAAQLIGPAQVLLRRAQQGRLTLAEYRGERAQLGIRAGLLDGLLALWQLAGHTLKFDDQAMPIGGMTLADPWLKGPPEEVLARVQAFSGSNQVKLLVAADQERANRRRKRAVRSLRLHGQGRATHDSARRWQKVTGRVSHPLDLLLLGVSQRLGSAVIATVTETQRIGDRRVVHRVDNVKVSDRTLNRLVAELKGRLDSSRLAELDLG
jgi:hypothetical protein